METETNSVPAFICVVCKESPADSEAFRCHLGHYVCNTCFRRFLPTDVPKCIVCFSQTFIRENLSNSHLNYLRRNLSPTNSIEDVRTTNDKADNPTLEELFQLPCKIIDKLLNIQKHRQQTLEKLSDIKSKGDVANTDESLSSSCEYLLKFELPSRKPIKCPHSMCNKTVAISSVTSHYKFDHCDLTRLKSKMGTTKNLYLDFSTLLQGKSTCLGIIELFRYTEGEEDENGKTEEPLGTFWVMLSDVPSTDFGHSFILIWLFTNKEEKYRCTLELVQYEEESTFGTQCCVNKIQESQDLMDILGRLSCLFITYGAFKRLDYYDMRLEVTINSF